MHYFKIDYYYQSQGPGDRQLTQSDDLRESQALKKNPGVRPAPIPADEIAQRTYMWMKSLDFPGKTRLRGQRRARWT